MSVIVDLGTTYRIYNIVEDSRNRVVKFSLDINGERCECCSSLKSDGSIDRNLTIYNLRVLNVVDEILKGIGK